ncbi:MAG: DUF58 domain-containing protein [Bacteroidetes bacterium]|nr:DUF58 domain-containing protein [Bacteroidota bacterium]MCB9226643.1 DUF58 domain-containing protein [Chitinophagales bacterium]
MKVLNYIASFLKNTWFTKRFFALGAVVVLLFALGFVWAFLFFIAKIVLLILLATTLVDVFVLYKNKKAFEAERISQKLLSNGDENPIKIRLKNLTSIFFDVVIYDELPEQLQQRGLKFELSFKAEEFKELKYTILPKERGVYSFGCLNVFFSSKINLVQRRQLINLAEDKKVYPSIIQMKKFSLKALEKTSQMYGMRKLRKIGQSFEFEQIRQYVKGDDIRKINWKATSKMNELMVNQYTEERSQSVYCIIDKSRNMKLPFYGLTLFDYAINSSLVLANISLQKHDKAGLITFSDKMDTIVPAGNKTGQLTKILENLYQQNENLLESNYELLYAYTKKIIPNRSLLFLFTNFESQYNLDRNINVLRKLSKTHVLVVIFFENTELSHYLQQDAEKLMDIYQHTIGEKIQYEKIGLIQKLRQFGIQTIYTKPEDLTVSSINKYLEIKAKGLV